MQYLYITNLSGDVVGITDLDGNVLAEYAYDEWGKLLEITADSDENKALAELNPLRYRGYYYDNETGMYYLQSRYYSPDLCRFISADDFSYITSSGKFVVNAYAYCANNPVKFSDPTGYAYVSEAGKVIAVLITEIFTCLDLQEIAKSFNIDFSFSDLADYMQKKVDLYKMYFDSLVETAAKDYATDILGFLSTLLGVLSNLPVEVAAAISILPYITNLINDYSGRYITGNGSLFMAIFDIIISGIVDTGGIVLGVAGLPNIGVLFTYLAEELYDLDSLREKAEFLAYNWYYFLIIDWSKK